MAELIFLLIALAALFALAMNRAPLWAWSAFVALLTLSLQVGLGHGAFHAPNIDFGALLGWGIAGLLFALSFPDIRRKYVTLPAYRALKGAMPTISDTEREALEAGTVGWDAELFSGTPDFNRLLNRAADHADGGGARVPRRADGRALPPLERLAHPPRAA